MHTASTLQSNPPRKCACMGFTTHIQYITQHIRGLSGSLEITRLAFSLLIVPAHKIDGATVMSPTDLWTTVLKPWVWHHERHNLVCCLLLGRLCIAILILLLDLNEGTHCCSNMSIIKQKHPKAYSALSVCFTLNGTIIYETSDWDHKVTKETVYWGHRSTNKSAHFF